MAILDSIHNIAMNLGLNFNRELLPNVASTKINTRSMCLIAFLLFCAAIPFELSQLIFAVIGAVTFALLQAANTGPRRVVKAAKLSNKTIPSDNEFPPSMRPKNIINDKPAPPLIRRTLRAPGSVHHDKPLPSKTEYRQPSTQPITRMSFTNSGLEAEVGELLGQIAPTTQSDAVVQKLARTVKQVLQKLIPEVEVFGFASGDLLRGTAFGVAVPEVDIVVNVSPHVLAARLQSHSLKNTLEFEVRKLQKSAIRTFTDRLVSNGGFKFRRSAFRSQDPKVTLLAPTSLGIHSEAIPIDFSVNSATPIYNAALLTECGQIEPMAKQLIMLIKRWAKDRGVCHASKGHLSPYSWSLLTMYFLQVGVNIEDPLLPPLQAFGLSACLVGQPNMQKALLAAQNVSATASKSEMTAANPDSNKSIGMLFKKFMHFYHKEFDCRNEAVSVRVGQRAPPGLALPLHIVLHEDGATSEVGLQIEDPFDQKRNLGDCVTAKSLARLREELARAEKLCSTGASLAEILEPWAPAERDVAEQGNDGDEKGD